MCSLGTRVYRLECILEWVLLVAGMLVEVVVVCMSVVVAVVRVLRNRCRTYFPPLLDNHNYYKMACPKHIHIAINKIIG